MTFLTITSEGSLISADLLTQIYNGEAFGQRADDFGLDKNVRLNDEIAAAWREARAYWEAFQLARRRLKDDDPATTITREQWMAPLLRSLGFENVTYMRSGVEIGGKNYPISHRDGADEKGLPIHIVGAGNKLDKPSPTGRPRLSPHALVQEYLNRHEDLWAPVTNGLQFRLLRDAARMSRPTFLEFDLAQMMESELFSEFHLFFRLVHRSRWPKSQEQASECLLEQYFEHGIETGGRVRDHLRDGVEEALKIFGNGFLEHPGNDELRRKLREGELNALPFYRQLLRLIYRFLFLMVSEERRLVGPDPADDRAWIVYDNFYSISRLRDKVERPIDPEERHWDLWEGVKQTFLVYAYEKEGKKLGISPLDGTLFGEFALPDFEASSLLNRHFLQAFAHLSLFKDGKVTRRINYAHLDVEELGSVYESLLDFHPFIEEKQGKLSFELRTGTERKSTGSYYTRPELVQELIKSALIPVIEERLEKANTKEEKEKALLNLKVCDPAAGSGHFLLAAARAIGKELARTRTGEDQFGPSEFRLAVRDVIQHCIYGVDLNELAVDLCKVALWLEGHNRDMPLTFLDHRIKHGNSLIGLDTLDRLKDGIPDDAFKPVTGDDKDVAKKVRASNREQRKAWEAGQISLGDDLAANLVEDLHSFAKQNKAIDDISEMTPEDYHNKEAQYDKVRSNRRWLEDYNAANLWTAAFFYPLVDQQDPAIPMHERLINDLRHPGSAHGQLIGKCNALGSVQRFFHWPLEFPEVAETGGFDAVLGNPPWARIKLQEQEFFATRDPEIAAAPNKAARTKLIRKLGKVNPSLAKEFEQAKHDAEATSRFVRASRRFPLSAVGDVNTFLLFAELGAKLLDPGGRSGVIVPAGIATDSTGKGLLNHLVDKRRIVSITGFENEAFIFPSVHHSFKFCLLTIAGSSLSAQKPTFRFFIRHFKELSDEIRKFRLDSQEIKKLNPNTRTLPVFRTRVDAEITKRIYDTTGVLVNEEENSNPWQIRFLTMFHMANDSNLFVNNPTPETLPLYEAKMIWQYDDRYGTYEGATQQQLNVGNLPQPNASLKRDPQYAISPRYWVEKREVDRRLKDWQFDWVIGFREITSSISQRTVICTVLPRVAVGNKIPLVFPNSNDKKLMACLIANLNSIVLDYVARQKVAGLSLSYFLLKQLPVLPPQAYQEKDLDFITERVVRLVYNSNQTACFANDMGYFGAPFQWDDVERHKTKCELDAYFALLYRLNDEDLRYLIDPVIVYGEEFPSETFRVLKEKELRDYSEYRTKRLILKAWDELGLERTVS